MDCGERERERTLGWVRVEKEHEMTKMRIPDHVWSGFGEGGEAIALERGENTGLEGKGTSDGKK